MPRRAYPSDVTDEEWLFVSPYLTLMREDAPQREHDLREAFNGLRWVVRTGPSGVCCPTTCRPGTRCISSRGAGSRPRCSRQWSTACGNCCEWLGAGTRSLRRRFLTGAPCSTPESGARAGYDGYKRKNGSKVHMAVGTLGLLLDLLVTPANEQERRQVEALGKTVQRA